MRCPIHICSFYDPATDGFLAQRLTVGDYFNRREIILAPSEAADGWLDPAEIDRPARYGRATAPRAQKSRAGGWQVTTPDGHVGSLNPDVHHVEEHEDGTITVTPSLDMSPRHPGGWHGWLRRGVFVSCA